MNLTPLERALAEAPAIAPEARAVAEEEFFIFRMATLFFAMPSNLVHEVTRLGALTAVPRAAPFVLGVAGHRGEVYPVIDLLRFFGTGEARISHRSRVFMTSARNMRLAMVVDEILGLSRSRVDARMPAPPSTFSSAGFVSGLLPIKDAKDPANILDVEKLVLAAKVRAVVK